MTREEIEQKAEEYVSHLILSEQEEENYKLTFIDGANSRDEEIEALRKLLFEKECDIQFLEHKLRHPWISVKERLPEEDPDDKGYSVEVIGMFPDESVSKCFCSIEEGIWFINGLTCDKPTYWMPTPELKKEGENE